MIHVRSRRKHGVQSAILLIGLIVSVPAFAQLANVQNRTETAKDGTPFLVTTGTVRVPESRTGNKPTGAIDLAVVRVRLQDYPAKTAHDILAGGPGDSGVNEVLNLAHQGGAAWFALMGGDIIGIDQRGTGSSRPSLISSARYNLPLDHFGSPDDWLPVIREASRQEAARLKATGVNLQSYNTEESADDVDAVRRAFGYEKMTVWGRSYGSHLALAVLRRHPEGIERIILVSPEGPDQTWKAPADTDKVLEVIAARAGAPNLIANIRKVLGDLARVPVSVPVVDTASQSTRSIMLGPFDIQIVVSQAIGDPRALAGLPAAFRLMAAGDYRPLGQLVYAARTRMGVQSAMKQAMDLSSGASAARRERITREAPNALFGNAINFPGMYLADAWGIAPLPEAFRSPVHSTVPTLILVGDLDVRTPVENAREIAATLSNSHVVVVRNAAHQFGLFGPGPLLELLSTFLAGQAIDDEEISLPPLPFQR